jgi:hypothetical protein
MVVDQVEYETTRVSWHASLSHVVRPSAAHYFATYLDNASIVKLHFQHFSREGMQTYRRADRRLHDEFTRLGSRYQLTRNHYGRVTIELAMPPIGHFASSASSDRRPN